MFSLRPKFAPLVYFISVWVKVACVPLCLIWLLAIGSVIVIGVTDVYDWILVGFSLTLNLNVALVRLGFYQKCWQEKNYKNIEKIKENTKKNIKVTSSIGNIKYNHNTKQI